RARRSARRRRSRTDAAPHRGPQSVLADVQAGSPRLAQVKVAFLASKSSHRCCSSTRKSRVETHLTAIDSFEQYPSQYFLTLSIWVGVALTSPTWTSWTEKLANWSVRLLTCQTRQRLRSTTRKSKSLSW